jgi:hypothetical protein
VRSHRPVDPLTEVRRSSLSLQFPGCLHALGVNHGVSLVRGILHHLRSMGQRCPWVHRRSSKKGVNPVLRERLDRPLFLPVDTEVIEMGDDDTLGQRHLVLPPQLAANGWLEELEIEDLVSLDCLDRFYEGESSLMPEAEFLVYGSPERRRLVVRGVDKERFIQWMERNATLDDVQNLVRLIRHIRWMFGLANGEEIAKNFAATALSNECRLGRRPKPWWYVSNRPGAG